ncbi:MAG: aminoglycoside phosphotransferase family protein [Kiritimatiellae bacterium]|nr:aminoglycoside phosphotransferase family protein [Kiritimatiellia bacterium]
MDIQQISERFSIAGRFVSAKPLGNGNVNETVLVSYVQESGQEARYVFQRINHNVFTKPLELMDNYVRVSRHIKNKFDQDTSGTAHRSVDVVLTKSGETCCLLENGEYWRAYKYLENTKTYEVVENADQAYEAAKTFAEFLKLIRDLSGERLHETIPDFHNTSKRIEVLEEAVKNDSYNRLKDVEQEVNFIFDRKEEAGTLLRLLAEGKLTERITHNDTKLNNVLLDVKTGCGVCVIDLDTVMPGLIHYDFGDMVRSGAASTDENESDLSKVYMKFDMYSAILHGFLKNSNGFMTPLDKELLPLSAKIITLETGVRFLTDYLIGDEYFKIRYPNENFDRARMQLKLVASMEEQFESMQNEVSKVICCE